MTRYKVVFSARALVSLREVTRYIAEESGTARAAGWLAQGHGQHGHSREPPLRLVDVVHSARETERERYERG